MENYKVKINSVENQPLIRKRNLIGAIALIGCFGLAALLGTPDQDHLKIQTHTTSIIQEEPTYVDSLKYTEGDF